MDRRYMIPFAEADITLQQLLPIYDPFLVSSPSQTCLVEFSIPHSRWKFELLFFFQQQSLDSFESYLQSPAEVGEKRSFVPSELKALKLLELQVFLQPQRLTTQPLFHLFSYHISSRHPSSQWRTIVMMVYAMSIIGFVSVNDRPHDPCSDGPGPANGVPEIRELPSQRQEVIE